MNRAHAIYNCQIVSLLSSIGPWYHLLAHGLAKLDTCWTHLGIDYVGNKQISSVCIHLIQLV